MGTFLDRVDADPSGVVDAAKGDTVTNLFTQVGTLMADGCKELTGDALSGLIVYLAGEANTRPTLTVALVESLLEGLCKSDTGFELNLQAQAACALYPS